MSEPENPFEDPDFAEEMRKRGIVHKPGMAAELMQEIAPLLKAEGIDLDDPDPDFDLDTLNAAMSRAVEQHNLGLMTPVASEREQVEQVLTEFAEALTEKRLRAAETVIESVEPEPSQHRPAASHVIGASLGMLDTWYSNADLRASLGEVAVPKWRGPARSIASRLIRAARKRDAYASLDELIMRHGGLLVMHAGALAVAGTIHAYAKTHGVTIGQAAQALWEHSGAGVPSGSAFGISPEPEEDVDELLAEFELWCLNEGIPDQNVELEVQILENMFEMGELFDLDLRIPADAHDFVAMTAERDDEEMRFMLLQTLDAYVHFQLDMTGGIPAWEEVHEDLAELAHSPEEKELSEALAATAALDDTERRQALNNVSVVNGVFPLLTWLGEGQPTTPAGGVRRAEIETVAKMIGVAARGTAKLPTQTETLDVVLADDEEKPDHDVVYARSTKDVPQLEAWWHALHAAQIIKRDGTRIRPGGWARRFSHGELPPLETSEILASCFVGELLLQELESRREFSEQTAFFIADKLHSAVIARPFEVEAEFLELHDQLLVRAAPILKMLEAAGIVGYSDDELTVPLALRSVVMGGIVMALSDSHDFDEV